MSYQQTTSNYTHLPVSAGLKSPNPFAGQALPSLDISDYHLRPIRASDLPVWYDYLILPEVMQHWSWIVKSPMDLQQFIHEQDWSHAQAQIKFAIADRDDQFIGSIGFHSVSLHNLSAEIAYDLSPRHWGRGIISAACLRLTNWAHQELGFVRVQATALDSNARSRLVLERCNFECEGLLKSYKRLHGKSRDFWLFSHIAPIT